MITSLQNFFLKHNKWLFGGLLVVIIVTFVLTIGPQSFFGGSSAGQRKSLNYYGYDLTSEQDQRSMAYTAEISAILRPELQLRRQQLMDYAYLRVTGLGIAAQLGIPHPDKEELATYVETMMVFADPQTGAFSAESYNRMVELLQADGRFTREAIARSLREDYIIDQVKQALGGPDYALPFENRQAFIDRDTQYTVELAYYPYADFTPEITPSEDELLQFFNENPGRYEIPETISVTALSFKAEAYMEEVAEPEQGDLEVYFATNPTRYQPSAAAETADAGDSPEITLEDVQPQVVADWKREQALKLAARKGEAFSLRLWQEGIELGSPAYQSLLDTFEVEATELAPYPRENAPAGADLPAQLLDSMWIYANNPNRYFSDAAQTSFGAVLLVNTGLTEARMPGFEEVKSAVAVDYATAEKRRLFAEKGQQLQQTLMAASGDFKSTAESLGMKVEELATFDGVSVPAPLQQGNLWDQTMHLQSGEVSPMVIGEDQGTFSHMVEKVVPTVDTESDAYKAFIAQRTGALSNAMGWARLREITDISLSALMGSSPVDIE